MNKKQKITKQQQQMTKPQPINALIKNLTTRLTSPTKEARVAQREAWWLLEKLTDQTEIKLLIQKSVTLTVEQQHMLDQWLEQLIVQKKPLHYILGSVPFCDLEILVESPILIPRPETEEIVCWLIETIKQSKKTSLDILDLCTGSGCIALALAAAFPASNVTGIDINPQAIALANKNKNQLKLKNVTFTLSNLYSALNPRQKFDLIISNPPYLSEESYTHVSDEIRLWEDKNALTAENEGMALYEKIISQAHLFLKPTNSVDKTSIPQLVLEIGKDQASIEMLLASNDFKDRETMYDMNGLARWVIAPSKNKSNLKK